VKTVYWNGEKWQKVTINDYDTTGFLSQKKCKEILQRNSPKIIDYEVDLEAFLKKANEINSTLHTNGVAARDRARIVAGLLLALVEDEYMSISDNAETLVRDVNTRIKRLLSKEDKESFLQEVELKLPATEENHNKCWSALVQTMQHLREVNIRSAINSGTDALGQFYETFLKYTNDANEMGIVLTPRHITKFAVDIMDIDHNDRIFDPTCGTGGFLVAALDTIRENHYNANHPDVYNSFKNDCLFGIEQSDSVFGLALVNMIFRGDGKSRIHNGNCYDSQFYLVNGDVVRSKTKNIEERGEPENPVRPFSRVLMNPPFAIKEEEEHKFVDYALKQVDRKGGLLFAILPNNPITGTDQKFIDWRGRLLEKHTLKAVVRMQDDLFYPQANKGTYALVLQAWRSHKPDDKVFFGIMYDDKHASKKSKLLSEFRARDNVQEISKRLKMLIKNLGLDDENPIPRELCMSTINMDMNFDFAPEAYLEDDLTVSVNATESTYGLITALSHSPEYRKSQVVPEKTGQYMIEDLAITKRGKCPPMKYLETGDIPVVTTTQKRNGIAGYYSVEDKHVEKDCFTISANGSGGAAFWHPYRFAAVGDVIVCEPKQDLPRDIALWLYICESITNAASWRFDYYRKCSTTRLFTDVRISLPMKGDSIDVDFIRREVAKTPGYENLMKMVNGES